MEKEFKYDAFISYRHSELDKFVAEHLHKSLETYNLPKEVRKKNNLKRRAFKRVFRDQEELPLTSNLEDPIIEALKNSKYLIVICSPRLKESLWCKKEIETFKSLRGRKNIFCVLIEGEPKDSFPNEVLIDEKGKLVEPLAADIRGKNKRKVLKKLKEEKLRLIAPMYNLDYDDLRQRHKIWRQKKIIHSVIGIAIACLMFTIYSIAMFIKINLQQNVLSQYQALSLATQANDYLKKDDRYKAINLSYQALTYFEDEIIMPYTPQAEYVLSESLGLYDVGYSYKAINQVKTEGVVDYIKSSDDSKYVAIYDESEKITLFDSKTLEIINKYNTSSDVTEESFTFIGNNIFSFINEKGNISLVNTIDGKLLKEIEKQNYSYMSLKGSIDGTYLSYLDKKNLYVYNIKEDKTFNISIKDKYLKDIYYSSDNNYLFVGTCVDDLNINKEDYTTIHVINLKEQKEINNIGFNIGYIDGIVTKGNNAYFLLNRIYDGKYSMLVVSYNFVDNNINWSKNFNNDFGKFIARSYKENNIAVVNYDTLTVMDASNGDIIETFSTGNEIVGIFSYINKDIYVLFLKNGSVNFANMEKRNNVEYKGKFELNLNYNDVEKTEHGFLLIPENDNRVILYEEKYNEEMVKEDIKLDYVNDQGISISLYEGIKEEYNIKNKNLVSKIIYDTNEELLFVNYKNKDISIYSVKDKKMIKTLENVGTFNHYFGKDKYNRTYIGDISDSYILDKNYDLVGHIKSLCKVDNDKLLISNGDDYYSLKIYTLKDMLKEAEKYINYEEK